MAIELLLQFDARTPRANQEAWMISEPGNAIVIKPHPNPGWGTRENIADGYRRVVVEGIDIDDPIIAQLQEPGRLDIDGITRVSKWRYRISISDLPNAIRTALSIGHVTVPANHTTQFRNALRER